MTRFWLGFHFFPARALDTLSVMVDAHRLAPESEAMGSLGKNERFPSKRKDSPQNIAPPIRPDRHSVQQGGHPSPAIELGTSSGGYLSRLSSRDREVAMFL